MGKSGGPAGLGYKGQGHGLKPNSPLSHNQSSCIGVCVPRGAKDGIWGSKGNLMGPGVDEQPLRSLVNVRG